MKLLYCPHCRESFSLTVRDRHCFCAKNHGRRTHDGKTVEVSRGAIVIGIPDPALQAAVEARPETGRGVIITTFVLPRQCTTIRYFA